MNQSCPLVSIIVPAYNHEDYVWDCIHSILEQDYPAVELIVINDGSTDSTESKIRELIAAQGEIFKFISKQNDGLIRTLNLGLSVSRGKYFCELASDDMLLPGSIRKRVDYMESHSDMDVAFADAYIMEGGVKTQKRLLGMKKKGFESSEHSLENFVNREAKIFFPTGVFRKSFLERLGGFDEDFRYCEDVFMRYQLTLFAKVGYINEPVMYYRQHRTNVSSSDALKTMPEKILALEKLFRSVKDESLRRHINDKLSKYYVKYLRLLSKNRANQAEMVKTLEKLFNIRPYSLIALYHLIKHKFLLKEDRL